MCRDCCWEKKMSFSDLLVRIFWRFSHKNAQKQVCLDKINNNSVITLAVFSKCVCLCVSTYFGGKVILIIIKVK